MSINLNSKITVVAKSNPKIKRPALRFALYGKAKTVADYIVLCKTAGFPRCVALADVKWDRDHKYIAITRASGAAKGSSGRKSNDKAKAPEAVA